VAFLNLSEVKSVLFWWWSFDIIMLEPMGVPYCCFILRADYEVLGCVSATLDTEMLLTLEKLFSRFDDAVRSMYY
jgi:hypothetical protein